MKNNLLFNSLEKALNVASNLSPKDTHGPIVKTGPTAGNNRSRNKDGTWRKQRSDAGKPRS